LTKKSLRGIIGGILKVTSVPETADFLDKIKDMGFSFAFKEDCPLVLVILLSKRKDRAY
jgi:hypothetical protein